MKDNFAESVVVDEEYRITIPETAREMFDIEAGEEVVLLGDANRGIAILTADMAKKKMGPAANKILGNVSVESATD